MEPFFMCQALTLLKFFMCLCHSIFMTPQELVLLVPHFTKEDGQAH